MPAQHESRSEVHWPRPDKGVHLAYAGRRLHCQTGIAMSAALLPAIQMSIFDKIGNGEEHYPVWQGGMKVTTRQHPDTDTLVEVPHGQLAINIITRGPDQRSVEAQQEMVCRHIEKFPNELSPGSRIDTVFEENDSSNIFDDEDHLASNAHLKLLDERNELDAGMAFFASNRLRNRCILPPAAADAAPAKPPEDIRLTHCYTHGASCRNAGRVSCPESMSRLLHSFLTSNIIGMDFPN